MARRVLLLPDMVVHGTWRAALLGVVASSLLSCGAADDDPADPTAAASTTTTPAPAPATSEPTPTEQVEAAPAQPTPTPAAFTFTTTTSPPFTFTEGTALWNNGYDAPELQKTTERFRWNAGAWTAIHSTHDARWEDSPLHPDFRVLKEHAPPTTEGDWFSPPVFASLPSGHVYVLGWAGGDLGVAHWSAETGATGATFTKLSTKGQYAVFPRAVLARSANDIWVAASATSAHFGKDFPGCPSILIAEQDNGIVAHFDGHEWKTLPFGNHGALSSIHLRDDDDAVEIVAGGSTFVVTTDGRWTSVEDRVKTHALEAGWKVEDGRVFHQRGAAWEDLALTMPDEQAEKGRFVPLAVHVVDAHEVWLEGQVVNDRESPPYSMPEPMWLRATLP